MSATVYQAEHELPREVLCRFLVGEVQFSRGVDGYGRGAGRARCCTRCLLLIRWIGGASAGRAGVPGGWAAVVGCAWSL